MPYIKVDTRRLSNFGNVASSTRSRVGNIKSSFSSIGSSLDWDVKACSGINRTISQINNELSGEMSSLRRMESFFDMAVRKYNDAEKSKEKLSKIPQTRRVSTLGPGGRIGDITKNVALLSVYKNNKTPTVKQVKIPEEFGEKVGDLLSKIAKKAGIIGSIYGIATGEINTIDKIKEGQYASALESFAGVFKGVCKTVPKIPELYDVYRKTKKAKHLMTPAQKLKKMAKELLAFDDYIKAPSKGKTIAGKWVESYKRAEFIEIESIGVLDIAISGVVSIIKNVSEYRSGQIDATRAFVETIGETAIDVVKDAVLYTLVGAGLAAATGAAVPVIAVAAVVVAVDWLLDIISNSLTGKDFTEMVSDGLIDFGQFIGNSVRKAVKTVAPVIRNACNNAINTVKNKTNEIFGNVKNGVNNFFGKLKFAF